MECPQIEHIDYLPVVDLGALELYVKDQTHPIRLTSVRELRIARLQLLVAAGKPQPLRTLALFPSLTALTFDACVKPSHQADLVLTSWPSEISSQLRELRVQGVLHLQPLLDHLTAARMTSLRTLEVAQSHPAHHPPLVDLASMLQSMPALERLSFTGLRVDSLNVLSHAPGLLSLSGLEWPYPDAFSAVKAHPLEQAPLCPALQSLSVGHADELYPLYCNPQPLLQRLFPALQRVQWRSLPAVTPSELPRLASQQHFAHLFDSLFHSRPRHIRVGLLSRAESMLAQRKLTHPTEVPHKQMRSVLSLLEQEVALQLFDASKHAGSEMPFEIDLGPATDTGTQGATHQAAASSSASSVAAAAPSAPPPVAFAFAMGGSGAGKKRAGTTHSAVSALTHASAATAPSAVFSPLSIATAPLQPFAAGAGAGAPFGSASNPFAASQPMFAAATNPFAAAASSSPSAARAAPANPFVFTPPPVPTPSAASAALSPSPFAFGVIAE